MHGTEFEPSTGERYVENITIDRSSDDLLGVAVPRDVSGVSHDGVVAKVFANHWVTGNNKKDLSIPEWDGSLVDAASVFSLIREKILPQFDSNDKPFVTVHSSTTREGVKFRANPRHSNGSEPKQEWALLQQSRGDPVPHQLLCILEIPAKPKKRIWLNGSAIDDSGFYALAHCALDCLRDTGDPLGDCQEGTLAHVDQDLIHRIPKAHRGAQGWVAATESAPPSLVFAPCDSIAGVISGIPDLMKDQCPATDYFFIRPRSEWADRFVERARKHSSTA